jgi:hypothetical protein
MDADTNGQKNLNSLPDWTAERQYFGRFYLSQGFNDKQGFTNDCGPASLAVTLKYAHFFRRIWAHPCLRRKL